MDFVDDVNLVTSLDRSVSDFVDKFADLIHAVIGGGVDFDDVRVTAFGDGHAVGAVVALGT